VALTNASHRRTPGETLAAGLQATAQALGAGGPDGSVGALAAAGAAVKAAPAAAKEFDRSVLLPVVQKFAHGVATVAKDATQHVRRWLGAATACLRAVLLCVCTHRVHPAAARTLALRLQHHPAHARNTRGTARPQADVVLSRLACSCRQADPQLLAELRGELLYMARVIEQPVRARFQGNVVSTAGWACCSRLLGGGGGGFTQQPHVFAPHSYCVRGACAVNPPGGCRARGPGVR
jgi:hypothetical protein